MKKLLIAILASVTLTAAADLIPRQDYTSDVSKPSIRKNLVFNEAGSQKLGWTFKQGTTAKDLTTATLTTFSYVHPDGEWVQVVTGALDVATNGSVLVTFTPAQLNTNSTDGGLFDWILKVSDGTLTMAYARGKLNLIEDPTGGVSGSFPTTSSTVNYALVAAYQAVAASGPYRAGSNVTFNANADGSVDVDVTVTVDTDTTFTNYLAAGTGISLAGGARSGSNTITCTVTDTDTTFTNYFNFTGPGTFTGAARSGSNTLTQILSDFTGIGLMANLVEDTTPQLGAQLDAQQYYIGGSTANKGMRVQDDGDVNFSVDNDFSIASVGSAGVLSLDMASMLVNDAFWMGLGSGAARIIYTNTTTDTITFSTANVRIGNGSPGVATAAESLYVEGNIETDGSFAMANGVTVTNILTTLTSNDVSLATGAAIAEWVVGKSYLTASANIQDLANVDSVAAPTANDVLTWVGSSWTNQAASGGGLFSTNTGNFGTFHTNVMTTTWAAVSNALRAAEAAGGGIVELSSGTYTIASGEDYEFAVANVWLRGKGMSTILDASGATQDDDLFDMGSVGHIWMSDMHIKGNRAGGSNFSLIKAAHNDNDHLKFFRLYLEDSDYFSLWLDDGHYCEVWDVTSDDPDQRGFVFLETDADGRARGLLEIGADAQSYTVGSRWHMSDCISASADAIGWNVSGVEGTYVNCSAFDAGQQGFYITGTDNTFSGGRVQDNGTGGMEFLGSATRNTVRGMTFGENGANACLKGNGVNRNYIIGITTVAGGTDRGIWLDNCDNWLIDGGLFSGEDVVSIQIDSDCDGNAVHNLAQDTTITDNSTTTHYGVEAQDDGLLYKGGNILELQAKVTVVNNASTTWSPTASQCYGALWVNNATAATDVTLPAAVSGMSFTIVNSTNAVAITVDAAGGDSIILNTGVKLDAGDSALSSSAVDDKGTFVAIDADTWMLISEQNAWSDGGP